MIIAGLTKLSLIDYPGKLSCIVFTQGCNFRCPFCHNPKETQMMQPNQSYGVSKTELFDFLMSRKGKLDGVCITGGEPTLHRDLEEYIREIRSLGFAIKLDSNGSNPHILQDFIDKGILDYVAMDIKSPPEKYPKLMGRKIDIQKIKDSVSIIQNSGLDYEFRTTVVPGLHCNEDFESIAKWIQGSRHYFLQEYREDITLDPDLSEVTTARTLDLEDIKTRLAPYFEHIAIRR